MKGKGVGGGGGRFVRALCIVKRGAGGGVARKRARQGERGFAGVGDKTHFMAAAWKANKESSRRLMSTVV